MHRDRTARPAGAPSDHVRPVGAIHKAGLLDYTLVSLLERHDEPLTLDEIAAMIVSWMPDDIEHRLHHLADAGRVRRDGAGWAAR
jgi:hypothetical protein